MDDQRVERASKKHILSHFFLARVDGTNERTDGRCYPGVCVSLVWCCCFFIILGLVSLLLGGWLGGWWLAEDRCN